ncbi:MAG: alcohol dehydrogenase, partial [Bacteroidota bacterium]
AIESRFDRVAAYLDIENGFDAFCNYVDNLNASLGVPKTLTELGVKDPNVDLLVAGALKLNDT